MTNLLENLSKDTLPESLLQDFMAWCAWEQARPALVTILQKTGLFGRADELFRINDYEVLATVAENARNQAHEARKHTGPLGMSTAEAASFLLHKLAKAALEQDAESVAFFSTQICGWQAFAEMRFSNPMVKGERETEARLAQEEKLQDLWKIHQSQAVESPDKGTSEDESR